MEQQLKGGVTPRTWYREHAHPVLLPLDEEETQLLRSLVGNVTRISTIEDILMQFDEIFIVRFWPKDGAT